jgi:hypothetical protein
LAVIVHEVLPPGADVDKDMDMVVHDLTLSVDI